MTKVFPDADLSKMYEPVQKLVDLNLTKFQSTIEAQTEATKSFVEQTDERLKAASDVKDFDALATFLKEQSEIARTNMERMIADSKSVSEEIVSYGTEVQKIMAETFTSAADTAKPAKRTTKK